jgi:hypothetical protein
MQVKLSSELCSSLGSRWNIPPQFRCPLRRVWKSMPTSLRFKATTIGDNNGPDSEELCEVSRRKAAKLTLGPGYEQTAKHD